ncbi:unnamed protein product [Protopolystoma xenopodis]|uniref:Uncharacterized protein n=1 Tax=Protopolystoma xenopodis TaxID=117903 RepID=A0A3S5AEP7_9PLAT|nr:unnamed protein product [Protopolystoma xenopodis]
MAETRAICVGLKPAFGGQTATVAAATRLRPGCPGRSARVRPACLRGVLVIPASVCSSAPPAAWGSRDRTARVASRSAGQPVSQSASRPDSRTPSQPARYTRKDTSTDTSFKCL